MSADNWTFCPRCEERRQEEVRRFDAQIAEAYGSVDIAKFDELRARRDEKANDQPAASLREDYEIYGIERGEFHVEYIGRCTVCGFSHRFEHHDAVKVGDGS